MGYRFPSVAVTLGLLSVWLAALVPIAFATTIQPPHPWEHAPLHKAVYDCSLPALRSALENREDINTPASSLGEKRAITPLALAFELYPQRSEGSRCARADLLKELIFHGATLNGMPLANVPIPTPFADTGSPEELRLLIGRGMSYTYNPKVDGRLLTVAVRQGNLELARALLDLGVSANATDSENCSSLYRAAQSGTSSKRQAFEMLLAAHADPDKQCGNDAPLHRLAAFPAEGDKNLLMLLLNHRADPNAALQKSDNRTPLESMVESSHSTVDIAELLLTAGAHLTPRLGILVVLAGDSVAPKWVDFLADHGYDLNYVDSRRGPLLMAAMTRDHIETVRALLKRGARPDTTWERPVSTTYPEAFTLSMMHVLPKNEPATLQALQLLLPYHPDMNAAGYRGNTPLLSLQNPGEQPKAIAQMLEAGANVRAVNQDRRGIVLRVVQDSGDTPSALSALRLVVQAGANVNLQDRNGNAPIMAAARRGKQGLARELIALGARVNVKNTDGLTPLHLAAFSGDSAMVEMLLSKGAVKSAVSRSGDQPCDAAALGQYVLKTGGGTLLDQLCTPKQAASLRRLPLRSAEEQQELMQQVRFYNDF